jgi:FAD/FMN-containing dehydrogenase
MMELIGWGRFPRQPAKVHQPKAMGDCRKLIGQTPWLARGLGRSYGDSSLNEVVVQTNEFDHFLEFDRDSGILTAEAGISFRDISRLIVRDGWFLPVTPGTSFVTLGGAIASDVHGKNHHISGCFSDHILWLDILLGTGEIVRCSPITLPDLFRATCGGMGLTGQIVSASIQLRRIRSSRIDQEVFRAHCLNEVCELFEEYQSHTYSVAWIDCLATGRKMGRSILMLGEHSIDNDFQNSRKRSLRVPIETPACLLNRFSVGVFNTIYYHWPRRQKQIIDYQSFFHPLDSLHDWNRLYGRQGFLQFQFVIPLEAGRDALREILKKISHSRNASFLAVLKKFGRSNENILSFPLEGYTLALDFKVSHANIALFGQLDEIVTYHGGRWYLAKDALMSKKSFRSGYPRWDEFERIRLKYGAIGRFSSRQGRRLGLQ